MALHSAAKGKLLAVIGDEYGTEKGNHGFAILSIHREDDITIDEVIDDFGMKPRKDTCVGFLLGGVGEINKNRHPNFMVVDKNTSVSEIEETFKRFIKRDDIDIILINQNVAELIRHCIESHLQPVPAVLEIPSKDHPYDASKDSILRRAKGMFNPEDMH